MYLNHQTSFSKEVSVFYISNKTIMNIYYELIKNTPIRLCSKYL